MGNSLHSDNPICPVNVIMPDPKFFNSIPKSPNPASPSLRIHTFNNDLPWISDLFYLGFQSEKLRFHNLTFLLLRNNILR